MTILKEVLQRSFIHCQDDLIISKFIGNNFIFLVNVGETDSTHLWEL